MKQFSGKFLKIVNAALLTLYVSVPVYAEDIEIYVNNNQLVANQIQPNILFILDTSGSMNTTLLQDELPAADMDPASGTDYSLRAGACFDNDKVYLVPPALFPGDIDCTPSFQNGMAYDMTKNHCQVATTAFNTSGFYRDDFSQWKSSGQKGWVEPATNLNNAANVIECSEDQAVHGNNAGPVAEKYISTAGAVPYTSSSANEVIAWDNIAHADLVMVSGNYMNYEVTANSGVSVSRLNVVRNVIENIMWGTNGVNIGLMKFNYRGSAGFNENRGAVLKYPVMDVGVTRNDLTNMKNWNALRGTPLTESLYEAYRVYAGDGVYFPSLAGSESTDTVAISLLGGSEVDADGNRRYRSPVSLDAKECQRQFVIMLSDGEPTGDTRANDEIEALIGGNCTGGDNNGTCLDDLAGYMNQTGFDTYHGNGVTSTGTTVTTYGVGFGGDFDVLKDMAEAGGGEYFVTYDSSALLNTLLNIIAEIKQVHTTFSSPAVSVNAFNRTSHRSELYFSVFTPSLKPHWDGNFKRYKLGFADEDNNVATPDTPVIEDKNGVPAIDPVTGFFKDGVTSFWTQGAADGAEAKLGGVASNLTNTRNVYTNIDGNNNLNHANNRVHENNTGIDIATLGIPTADATYRSNLLKWARGIDVKDENDDGSTIDARLIIGDPLHSQPALIQYDGDPDDPSVEPEIVAYIATNDGYLHAIDTREAEGTELFSFVPQELLQNLDVYYRNDASDGKTYGIDGSVVTWVNDVNKNGIIESAQGDHVYIYYGMRRGGQNYYAMDVTDRTDPKMLWTINGGAGDFVELGQTWSKPVLRKVRVNGADTMVLVFAGGYDTTQDGSSLRNVDSVGRAVYMVGAGEAATGGGQVIWRAAHDSDLGADLNLSEMTYSMPADLAAVDSNADGYLDVIYAGDMGGQIFRFDFPGSEVNNALGGRIAVLASDTLVNSRRFYYQPDVAIIKNADRTSSLALVISSGYRSHPNNQDIQDRIYMIRDQLPISGVTPSYSTITESDLFDTTDNLIGEDGTAAEKTAATTALNNADGWYIDLESTGEKGLAKPFIFDGKVFVTTFLPTVGAAANVCSGIDGNGQLYIMGLADAQPKFNFDPTVGDDTHHFKNDRIQTLNKGGIPADPILIKIKDQEDVTCVGTECLGVGGDNRLRSEYWYEQ